MKPGRRSLKMALPKDPHKGGWGNWEPVDQTKSDRIGLIKLLEEGVNETGSDRMGETDDAVTPSKETEEIHQAETQKLKKPKEDAEETDSVEENEKNEHNEVAIQAQETEDTEYKPEDVADQTKEIQEAEA